MYSLVLSAHAAAGVLTLLAYWTAGLARKGSPLHRMAGRWFAYLMLFILLSGIVFVGRLLREQHWAEAGFFAYLLVISSTALTTAWFSLKYKREPARYFAPWYQGLGAFNLLCGAAILWLGLEQSRPVLMGFSLVGLIRGAAMLWQARHAPLPRWWLQEHLGSMIGNGVAVHVAFLLVGLDRLLPPAWQGKTELIGWLLPLGVAGLAGLWLGRKYLPAPR